MSKIKQSPKMPPEKRREQLLKAALKLFLKKGYKTTTTEEIARKADLTKGALYHHFKNKEDILFELVKNLTEKMSQNFRDRLRNGMEPHEIFRVMIEHHKGIAEPIIKDLMDIYGQSFRINRIKRYINKHMQEGLNLLFDNINPRYAADKKQLNDLGIFIFALHDGLSVLKMFIPSLVDEERQIKFIETCFDFNKLTAKKAKGTS
jgi:AcrR family transcriptional regulator